ncbi:MAG: type II toxin-antitoxin system VapC family toxin [Microcystis aeruginosa G13-12]|nr:type II toxin-antitoxin system VapC family toxin [Microcystis aeruginosa SX13-11]NCR45603.1 type II toxin-antitoxin system VapC family toxin [Microcystis aeruginosa SX13-01]NCR66776.1 type II toxin-antitoxin system VapC family toxin [Microcystis aeruginosa LL11-07]NCR90055.1 type II toxin-antitoxin system VapC family toxin [Microcystis aeruginosa G13-10]NCS15765.1 type II toxin-antitoxin system VapC family toxin [Microcystis aeruginosa G13-12]NCS21850.1 type II toxin-antitoxin system VapC f
MSEKYICVDSNFVVRLVSNSSETSIYLRLWDEWEEQKYTIVAPTLLCYEITNVFHRMTIAGQILEAEAKTLLGNALELSIRYYADHYLHHQAIEIARQFNLSATYDAHYLALAQRFNADFYTGDKRLFNTIKSVIDWVYLGSAE